MRFLMIGLAAVLLQGCGALSSDRISEARDGIGPRYCSQPEAKRLALREAVNRKLSKGKCNTKVSVSCLAGQASLTLYTQCPF